MTKMDDVAKYAEVSSATVSRVLSKPETVKPETREKVLKAIEELNYQPNKIARQFRMRETKMIVVVVPDITNPFFSKIFRGIESVAIKNGYQVLLGDTGNDVEKELEYINLLHQRQVDGLILLTARIEKSTLEEIAQKYPVVLACEYIEGSDVPTISIDNISAARSITEHLIHQGHKKIGHITGPMDVILSKDRLKGYQQAMSRYDLPVPSTYIQIGDYSFESGYNIMLKLLALEEPPTALFAANDEMAVGAIKAAKYKGFSVPQDIAIVGFDNTNIASIIEPSLTTIDQPRFDMGQKAMDMLVTLIQGEQLEKRQVVLNEKLIVRESCGFSKM